MKDQIDNDPEDACYLQEEVKKIFAGQEDRIKEDVASRKAVDLVKENVAK